MEVQLNSITEVNPTLIDADRLARMLGISVHTVRGLRSRNPDALPSAIKIGGSVRWRPEVVARFLDEQTEVRQ